MCSVPQYSMLRKPNPQGVVCGLLIPGSIRLHWLLNLPVKGLECPRLPVDSGHIEKAQLRILTDKGSCRRASKG